LKGGIISLAYDVFNIGCRLADDAGKALCAPLSLTGDRNFRRKPSIGR
jgi:hypothetical protein